MSRVCHPIFIRILGFLLAAGCAFGAAPRIFYSDLDSGPKTGGQNNNGVFVTVYGARFGNARENSYIAVGGGRIGSYLTWTDTKIAFQLGPAAATGEIIVTTPAGASNGVPFTVRPGRIYFVAVNGSDGADGSYSKPWRTLLKARDAIQPGDTVYAMDGVSQTVDDGQGWRAAMLIRRGGTEGLPMALVAYPGSKVTIGSTTGPPYGIRTNQPSYWTIAGFTLRGLTGALILGGPASNWRIIGNDLSCPEGDGQVGCLATGQTSYLTVLGNNIHHAGKANASSHYHGVYFSTDSNHIDMGWNTVAYVRGCRGIQVYSTPLGPGGSTDPTGHNMYDLRIHDNLIHDTQCDGLILATIDPSRGKVEVYNNIIYNAGTGPSNPENTGGWTCINVGGSTANGPAGGGTVEVYNNTMYNCGSFDRPPYINANGAVENGGNNSSLKVRLINNIVYQTTSAPYLVIYGAMDAIQGASNLFFGNGTAPRNAAMSRSLNADPRFVNASGYDFRLTSTSPARSAGVATDAVTDRAGLPRGGDAGYDLGALQYEGLDLSAIGCNPNVLRAPGATTCQIELNDEAPSGGVQLAVTSDSSTLVTPGQVTVPAGAAGATFPVDVQPLDARATARLSVRLGDSIRAVDLYLIPTGDTAPALLIAVSSGSLLPGPIAPGTMVTAFGWNLAAQATTGDTAAGGQSSDSLGEVAAFFDQIRATVLYVTPNQLNAVVPFGVAASADVRLQVDVGGRWSNPLILLVAPTAPAVFTTSASGRGQAVAFNDDRFSNSANHPALRESVVVLYATGLGETDPPGIDGMITAGTPAAVLAPIFARIGEIEVQVLYACAAPGSVAGLYEVAVRIPFEAPRGEAVPLLIRSGQMESQPGVTMAID